VFRLRDRRQLRGIEIFPICDYLNLVVGLQSRVRNGLQHPPVFRRLELRGGRLYAVSKLRLKQRQEDPCRYRGNGQCRDNTGELRSREGRFHLVRFNSQWMCEMRSGW
jgi:hypothetical protein